jgi:hypothetical protein
MLFELSWYLPKRVIHVHILGMLELSDVEAMSQAVAAFMEEGTAPVHILLDDAKGGRPPISLKEMQARMEIANHPSIGWIVGVGEADPVAKFLIPLLMKIVNMKYTRVATIEDGLNFLAKQDASLKKTGS